VYSVLSTGEAAGGSGGGVAIFGGRPVGRAVEGRGFCSTPDGVLGSAVQRTDARAFPGASGGRSSLTPAVGLCGHVAGAAGIGAGAVWAPARGRGNGPAPHRTATSGLGGRSTLCAGGRFFAAMRQGQLAFRAGVVWAPAIARAFPGAFGSRHSSPTPAVGGGGRAAGAAGIQAGVEWAPAIARAFPGAFWRAEGSLTPAVGGCGGGRCWAPATARAFPGAFWRAWAP